MFFFFFFFFVGWSFPPSFFRCVFFFFFFFDPTCTLLFSISRVFVCSPDGFLLFSELSFSAVHRASDPCSRRSCDFFFLCAEWMLISCFSSAAALAGSPRHPFFFFYCEQYSRIVISATTPGPDPLPSSFLRR